jgi:serine/threonine-protein kinase
MITPSGEVKVMDFGIARATTSGDTLTQTATVLGTASYISPEQAKGERATPASDLYALGVVAFELLTGRRPFEADSVAAEAAAHVTGEIPSVCDVDPDAPCELDPVFERALAKDPARRFPSGAELVAALRQSLEHAAGPTRIVPPRHVTGRRMPWLLPLGGLLLVAGVIGAIVATRGGGKSAGPGPLRVTTIVKRVTAPSQTVVSTVVTTAPPPTTTAVGGDPVDENNRAWALMQQGNYNDALPLLQDAQQQLNGQGSLAEAYTDYNLGYTLMQLGQCSEAIPYLDRSKHLQHGRHEVEDALKQARKC